MQTILTTAGLSSHDAFELWHEVSNATLARHQSSPLDQDNFYAELKVGTLGDLSVLALKTGCTIGRSQPCDDAFLLMSIATRFAMVCGERQVEVNGNGLVLFDGREPYSGFTLEPANQIGLRISRDVLAQRIPVDKEITNRLIPKRNSATLLVNFLRSLVHTGPSTLEPMAKVVVREHVLDLVALMLGNFTGVTPELTSPARSMVVKLRAAIESRLTDLTADRASIAAAAGISERHANRLLAQEGTSITGLLRKRRLATCREAIERSNREINDIAREFGWTRNFARDFKQEFGLTPREARLFIHKK